MRHAILDHGYVEAIEHWGSDERIIEAARMSTDKGFQGWGPTCSECGWAKGADHEAGCSQPETYKAGDEKLLRYLWEHKHATPFEMAGLTIEVQAPIFVFREWHRHRTQSYNELSARYTPMPDLSYLPRLERCLVNGGSNKQAGAVAGVEPLNEDTGQHWRLALEDFYDQAEEMYQQGLRAGVPKELARLCVPVGRYSRMRASANLRNWLAFLTLRNDPAAQWEIRMYAVAVQAILSERFPRTLELFAGGQSK